jgi:hypothetical protein
MTETHTNLNPTTGVETLTPARALIAELVRRYWILGIECSLIEIQKLAWFLERVIEKQTLQNPLNLTFKPNHYGPYSDNLRHLLDALDGSYLKSEKRLADANPLDVIWFDDTKRDRVNHYLHNEGNDYLPTLELTTQIINGFESPYGLELLATVDWLICQEHCEPTVNAIQSGLQQWSAGKKWADRKIRLFDSRTIKIALNHLQQTCLYAV